MHSQNAVLILQQCLPFLQTMKQPFRQGLILCEGGGGWMSIQNYYLKPFNLVISIPLFPDLLPNALQKELLVGVFKTT